MRSMLTLYINRSFFLDDERRKNVSEREQRRLNYWFAEFTWYGGGGSPVVGESGFSSSCKSEISSWPELFKQFPMSGRRLDVLILLRSVVERLFLLYNRKKRKNYSHHQNKCQSSSLINDVMFCSLRDDSDKSSEVIVTFSEAEQLPVAPYKVIRECCLLEIDKK